MNWISVNDELPPDGEHCIVWLKEDEFIESEFLSTFKGKENRFISYGHSYPFDFTKDVTHYMIPNKPNQ